MKYYNDTNSCEICETSFELSWHPYREHDEKGDWTGRWICQTCYAKDYNKKIYSGNNIIKSLRNRRTGNINKNSSQFVGDMFEKLTCLWRGIENLNINSDNYRSPIDHSPDSEFGTIQTKGRLYNSFERFWPFSGFDKDWEKNFDVMICYCARKDGKTIERIYIFPKKEILERRGTTIMKEHSRGIQWYEQYRVKDENVSKLVNELWKKIITGGD